MEDIERLLARGKAAQCLARALREYMKDLKDVELLHEWDVAVLRYAKNIERRKGNAVGNDE